MNLTRTVTSLSAAPCATGSGPLALRDSDRDRRKLESLIPTGRGSARGRPAGMGLAAYRASTCGAPQAASEVDPWQDGPASEKKNGPL